MANVGTKVRKNSERTKRLSELFSVIEEKGYLGAHELLHGIDVALSTNITPEQARKLSTDKSKYFELGKGVTLRVANHYGTADTFKRRNNPTDNYGIVIKLSPARFKESSSVDYLEYVYFPDRLKDGDRQKSIVEGLKSFIETGDFNMLPKPDKVNPSGIFRDKEHYGDRGIVFRTGTDKGNVSEHIERQREHAQQLINDLGGKGKVVTSKEELDAEGKSALRQNPRATGWYNPATGEVTVYLPNCHSKYEAQRTVIY